MIPAVLAQKQRLPTLPSGEFAGNLKSRFAFVDDRAVQTLRSTITAGRADQKRWWPSDEAGVDDIFSSAVPSHLLVDPPGPYRPEQPATLLQPIELRVPARFGWISTLTLLTLIRLATLAVGIWSIHNVHFGLQIDHNNASGTPWVAFDGGFYRNIMLHGYPTGPVVPFQIAYFPLYPYAARLFLPLMSASAALCTLSNLCSIVGLAVVYGWSRSITNARTAFFATMLLATYPGAVFYCASLTEGMFMMFVAIVMYLLTSQRLWTAAIVCAIATACRPTAIALSATVFFWTIWNTGAVPMNLRIRKVILIGMLSVVGGACYQGFMWQRYHRFDAYKIAEDKWDTFAGPRRAGTDEQALKVVSDEWQASSAVPTAARPPGIPAAVAIIEPVAPVDPPRYSLAFFESRMRTSQAWNRLITLALMIMLVGAVIKRSAVPRLLLIVPLVIFLMAYLPNFGLRASSILRYESAGVPLFAVLAYHLCKARRQPLLYLTLSASMCLQLYYAFLFSRGSWIG